MNPANPSTRSYTLRISLADQQLALIDTAGRAIQQYSVSTSKHGAGERNGSHKTPRGRHVLRARIGAGQPLGAVFRGRRPTGEIYSEALAKACSRRDWILTRILWLSGCEPGRNRFGNVDTMRRYIYIHGAPASETMGVPGSIGCIRMTNAAVVELFELVESGTAVHIE